MNFSLFVAGLVVAVSSETCPQGVDRDLKIAVAFDATSNCYWTRESLAYIGDSLTDIESWVGESDHSLLVSKHRLGDGNMSPAWCSTGYQVNRPVEEIGISIGEMGNFHYLTHRSPISSAAMIFLIFDAWPREDLHSERRIYLHASSHWPIIGKEELPLHCGSSFADLCPTHDQGTLSQVRDYVLGHGIGIFAWIYQAYQTDNYLKMSKDNWNSWLNTVGVTDYYMVAEGGSGGVPRAGENFKEGIRTLACPSWIATTTTYEPYAPSRDVQSCLTSVYENMGIEVVSNEEKFKKELSACVY